MLALRELSRYVDACVCSLVAPSLESPPMFPCAAVICAGIVGGIRRLAALSSRVSCSALLVLICSSSSAPPCDSSTYSQASMSVILRGTHFSCTLKSSVVSSSSQLSSHKCVLPACAPTSSSFAQSVQLSVSLRVIPCHVNALCTFYWKIFKFVILL